MPFFGLWRSGNSQCLQLVSFHCLAIENKLHGGRPLFTITFQRLCLELVLKNDFAKAGHAGRSWRL